jgi:glc operon protein GlcG
MLNFGLISGINNKDISMHSFARSVGAFICTAVVTVAVAQPPAGADQGGASRPRNVMQRPPMDPAPGTIMTKQSISARGAQTMIEAIVADAVSKRQAVSISIVDEGGNLIAFKRMDGADIGTIQAAMNKAVSALKLQMPSGALGQTPLATQFMSAGFTILGGGEPIKVGDNVVGAIAVSGGDDAASVQVGLKAFKP